MGFSGLLHNKKNKDVDDKRIPGALKSLPEKPREFKYKHLNKATNNFNDRLKVGQGRVSVVYKGVLSSENVEVAVKKFKRESMMNIDALLIDLRVINCVRHKHLVRLLGWCYEKGMLLLVYEYIPNGSLYSHLFGDQKGTSLHWDRRCKIISGVASALHYLHCDRIVVHRDMKASNVLLDSNYNAYLGDFGLTCALDHNQTFYDEIEGVTGTLGYIAPECFYTGQTTTESDVYAFGAIVLEVVCGQQSWSKNEAGAGFLVDYVWGMYREGRILEAVDTRLEGGYVVAEAEKFLLLGLACSHPAETQRPKTQSIFQIISGSVPVPYVPPFKSGTGLTSGGSGTGRMRTPRATATKRLLRPFI